MPNARPPGPSAASATARKLRDALTLGELPAGAQVVEDDLARTYGVTRASLRGALTILISEGLVENARGHGMRIRTVSSDEVIDLMECRLALEAHCARRAAERVTEPEIARLKKIGVRMDKAVTADDHTRYRELDQELHRLVKIYAHQPVLAAALDRLNAQLVPQQLRSSGRSRPPRETLTEHLSIIEGISRQDGLRRR